MKVFFLFRRKESDVSVIKRWFMASKKHNAVICGVTTV